MSEFYQYLAPAGNGIHTVHTAKERKQSLHEALYQTSHDKKLMKAWKSSLEDFDKNPRPAILGIPSDCGGGILRSTNWGPLFIRQEYLKTPGQKLFDFGDIRVIPHLLHDKYLNEETIKSCQNALYNGEDLPVSPLSIASRFCENFYKKYPKTPLLGLGGDHSVSYPLCSEWIKAQKDNSKIAIIHFDAHTDLLKERLGIDLCFGSWTYHILELLASPSQVYQIGIRSSGYDRSHWESSMGVQQFWSEEVKKKGFEKITETIKQDLKMKEVEKLYVSFDIDCLDSKYVSATGTPEPDGMEPHECISMIKSLAVDFEISSADIVEVAPFLNTNPETKNTEPASTLMWAEALVSCFGDIFHGNS
jgi:agmatinase